MRTTLTVILLLTLTLAGTAQGASFKLLAPEENSVVSTAKILVIAKVEGAPDLKQVEILDNGKSAVRVPLKGGVAVQQLILAEGAHEITLAGADLKRLSFKVVKGAKAGYAYHADCSDPAACVTCHPGSAQGVWTLSGGEKASEASVCIACHDAQNNGTFVHGPVAADSCSPCHDPHGSSRPSFLVETGKALCMACHSQTMSATHVEQRANAECLKCHDPHSSQAQFHLRRLK